MKIYPKEINTLSRVKEFYDELPKDPEIAEKFNELNTQYKERPRLEQAAPQVVAVAKEFGFDFTTDELLSYVNDLRKNRVLADSELVKSISGSYDPNHCFCPAYGGGKSLDGNGATCSCFLGGGGKKDEFGKYLVCVGMGSIIGGNV